MVYHIGTRVPFWYCTILGHVYHFGTVPIGTTMVLRVHVYVPWYTCTMVLEYSTRVPHSGIAMLTTLTSSFPVAPECLYFKSFVRYQW